VPNTRVDVHLCNPVGTSSRGYRPRSASQWCTRRACWRAQEFFPRALHQHARLGRCRLYFGARACRIRALMCISVTQWGLGSAGTALGLLRFAGSRRAGGVGGSFSSGTSPARCRLYFGAKACRICALMCTSVTQWELGSAATALGVLRNGAHGSRRAGGVGAEVRVGGSFPSGTSPARPSG
jgi:hypothetical protein